MINFYDIPVEHATIYSTYVTRASWLIEKGYYINCDPEELARCMYQTYLDSLNKNDILINTNTN